jgi:hypothetical protein
MNRSDNITDLCAALSKAQGAIKGATKDANNPHFRSNYATLAAVWEACREPLSEHGLAVVQLPGTDEHGLYLETILTHATGQFIGSVLYVTPVKDDPQGIGSAITYARRYSLQAIVGIAPEDDDGEAAMGRGKASATSTPSQPKPTQPQPIDPKNWRDAISHGESTKGKRLGDIPKDTVKGITEHLRKNAKTPQDKKFLVFCEMAMAELFPKVADEIPMNHGAESQEAKSFLSVLEYEGEYTAEQFMEVAKISGWVSCETFSELSEDKIRELHKNLDAVVLPALKQHFKKEAK